MANVEITVQATGPPGATTVTLVATASPPVGSFSSVTLVEYPGLPGVFLVTGVYDDTGVRPSGQWGVNVGGWPSTFFNIVEGENDYVYAASLTADEIAAQVDFAALIAAVADGGRLDELIDAIKAKTDLIGTAASGNIGPGADDVTISIVPTGVTADNIAVWINSSAGGPTIAGTRYTSSSGEVLFKLDAGETYYLNAQKDGMESIDDQSFVAVAD